MLYLRVFYLRLILGVKTLQNLFDISAFEGDLEKRFRSSQEAHFVYIMSALSCLAFLSLSGFSIQRALGAVDPTHNQSSRIVAVCGAVTFGLLFSILIAGIGSLDLRKKLATGGYYVAGCIGSVMNSFRAEIPFDGDVVGFVMILLTTSASSRLLHKTAISWLLVSLTAYYLLQFWMYSQSLGPYSLVVISGQSEVIDIRKINIYVFQAGICAYVMFRFNEARERRLFQRECFLEKSAKERLQLLQSIGHDLRQPMTAISLHCDLAKSSFLSGNGAQFHTSLEVVAQNLEVMNAELTQITEIAASGRTDATLNVQAIDFSRVLEQLKESYSLRAHVDTIRLTLQFEACHPSEVHISSDLVQIRKITTNLLNNAMKYTALKGIRQEKSIQLIVKRYNRCVFLEVRDTGIGIAAGNLQRIWEPFYQIGNPERNRALGFGLGLAHVKSAVEQLPGHSIKVASKLGEGTVFTLQMPLVELSTDLNGILPDNNEATYSLTDDSPEISGVLVFILEDDAVLRQALVQALEELGCVTVSAPDVATGMDTYFNMEIALDLCIVDHRLPDGSGRDFILEVNARAVEFGLVVPPIIYLTGEHSSVLNLSGIENTTLLRKPIDIQTLRCTISTLVSR